MWPTPNWLEKPRATYKYPYHNCGGQPHIDKAMPYVANQKPVEGAHSDSIWTVAWTGTNKIVTGGLDETVRVWNGDTLERLDTFTGHQLGVVSVDAKEKICVSSSLDSRIRVWDLEESTLTRTIDCGPSECWSVSLSPDERFVASGSRGGQINVWNVETGNKEQTLDARSGFLMTVAYSPDGTKIAAGSIDGTISTFETKTGRCLHRTSAHVKPIRDLKWHPNSKFLVTASEDKNALLFDPDQNQQLRAFTHNSWVLSVDFCENNNHIATGGSDKRVKVFDWQENRVVNQMDAGSDQVWGVKYNKAGDKLACVSDDKSLRVYEWQQ